MKDNTVKCSGCGKTIKIDGGWHTWYKVLLYGKEHFLCEDCFCFVDSEYDERETVFSQFLDAHIPREDQQNMVIEIKILSDKEVGK